MQKIIFNYWKNSKNTKSAQPSQKVYYSHGARWWDASLWTATSRHGCAAPRPATVNPLAPSLNKIEAQNPNTHTQTQHTHPHTQINLEHTHRHFHTHLFIHPHTQAHYLVDMKEYGASLFHICEHTHTQIHIQTPTYIQIHTQTHTHTHTHTHIKTHTHTSKHPLTPKYTHT